ncbi:hypothetical protein GLYMA_20G027700v4 [Glycine max]|nr:hypothetical protein GLYMA_20G027700v4 [Glycine max]KAH1034264.1 hypothetical protein GYH30_054597 [Glycine max]
MYVKMRITCTWTKKPYETLLFAGIGIGLFLRSLGEGQRRLPSGRPKPVVRYNSGRARVLVVNQDYFLSSWKICNFFCQEANLSFVKKIICTAIRLG